MAADLTFDVLALDKASKTFVAMSAQVEKLARRLDKLDRKDVDVKIDVDTEKPTRALKKFSGTSSGIMAGAAKIVTANVGIMAAVVVAALATLPAAAALAGTGIALGVGAGLATIGIVAAAQNEKVKKAFTDLKDHVVSRVTEMAVPFEATLIRIADIARRTFDSFAPALRRSFRDLAPTLSVFADDFGRALEGLKPAIKPLTDAFGAIVRQLGPRLVPLFKDIGRHLGNLGRRVEDNAVEFALFIEVLLRAIPQIIRFTTAAAGAMAAVIRVAPRIASGFLGATEMVIQGLKFMTDSAIGAAEKILRAMTKAFGWVPGLGPKLKTALAKMEGFREGAKRTFDKAIAKTREWRTALDRMPKEVRLRGHIRDLEQKIRVAKRRIKSVPPSQRHEIRARIAQLRRQVRAAKRALNSIQDETVNINIMRRTFDLPGTSQSRRLMQHGGPVRAHEPVIVGEKRPEVFVPDRDGTVLPRVPPRSHPTPFSGAGGRVVLEIRSGGSRMDDLLVEVLRRSIRVRGGSVETVLGGR